MLQVPAAWKSTHEAKNAKIRMADFKARCRSWLALVLRCPIENRKSEIENENGGGGEIRTHEGLRPAGFQDQCIQPLCHPSDVVDRDNCAIERGLSKPGRLLAENCSVEHGSTYSYVHVNLS